MHRRSWPSDRVAGWLGNPQLATHVVLLGVFLA
jgi:hypothetical protein